MDLGTREDAHSLATEHEQELTRLLYGCLGPGAVTHIKRSASARNRTITAFGQDSLGLHAGQIEMKPSVRIPFRRTDASAFAREGPFCAPPERVTEMMEALADFVEYLKGLG